MDENGNNQDSGKTLGLQDIADKVPPPLNPGDPLNSFIFSMGGNNPQGDNFKTMPGIDGIPHRAKGTRYYKNDDPAHMRPQEGGQVQCETFDMGIPKDKLAYQVVASRVFTMARQDKATILAVERNFSGTSVKIYLEWVEMYTYDATNPRMHSHAETGIMRWRD